MTAYALFAIFTTLSILDVATTIRAIESGKGKESKRIMRWLMEKMGLKPALYFSKVIILAAIGFAFWDLDARLSVAMLVALDGYYGWVVWNNYKLC